MKRLIVLNWILACITQSYARQAKGAKVIAISTIAPDGKTFALLITISKFQLITKLPFADLFPIQLFGKNFIFNHINRTHEFKTLMKK